MCDENIAQVFEQRNCRLCNRTFVLNHEFIFTPKAQSRKPRNIRIRPSEAPLGQSIHIRFAEPQLTCWHLLRVQMWLVWLSYWCGQNVKLIKTYDSINGLSNIKAISSRDNAL